MNLNCLFRGHTPRYFLDADNLMSDDVIKRQPVTYQLYKEITFHAPPGLRRRTFMIAICRVCGALYQYDPRKDPDSGMK